MAEVYVKYGMCILVSFLHLTFVILLSSISCINHYQSHREGIILFLSRLLHSDFEFPHVHGRFDEEIEGVVDAESGRVGGRR